jgi:hypothetical protein
LIFFIIEKTNGFGLMSLNKILIFLNIVFEMSQGRRYLSSDGSPELLPEPGPKLSLSEEISNAKINRSL